MSDVRYRQLITQHISLSARISQHSHTDQQLTRHSFKHDGLLLFISSGGVSYGFVARGEDYDAEEGDDQGPEIGDSPAFEDDAEVLGVPGEEHVHVAHGHRHVVAGMVAVAHVSVVHVGVIHGW